MAEKQRSGFLTWQYVLSTTQRLERNRTNDSPIWQSFEVLLGH
jgi:hypothetical protein